MNNQPMKRRDPFAKPLKQETPKKEEIIEQEEEIVDNVEEQEEEVEEIPVQQPIVRTPIIKNTSKQTPKTSRQSNKISYIQEDVANRQKYTATMDVTLRRRIKIVCATRGIMFSEFIEAACIEKLNREGER